jgi:hypothetical protein
VVDKSEKFRWLVRLGFAARGIVYLLIGYLALSSAGKNLGPEGAFDWLREIPLGTPILYLSALGLLGYGLYRLASLLFDVENYGTDASGATHRIGHGASGLAHLVLAWTAFQFAQGSAEAAGSGAEDAAASLLTFDAGPAVLGLIGIGFLAAAVMQGKQAVTLSFMREISPRAPAYVCHLGRGGYAARAVVFLIIGWSLVQSAWLARSGQVKTLGEAVSSLQDNGALYTLVAIGLMLFGVFSLFLARYRIIPDVSEAKLRPHFQ